MTDVSASTQMLPLTETVAPGDPAEVAKVVQDAWRSGTPVYPIGGGTSLDCGARPSVPGIGLSLAGLNQVIAHETHDMTITVGAGISIAELGRLLVAQGQRLPVDVCPAARAALGGGGATQ